MLVYLQVGLFLARRKHITIMSHDHEQEIFTLRSYLSNKFY